MPRYAQCAKDIKNGELPQDNATQLLSPKEVSRNPAPKKQPTLTPCNSSKSRVGLELPSENDIELQVQTEQELSRNAKPGTQGVLFDGIEDRDKNPWATWMRAARASGLSEPVRAGPDLRAAHVLARLIPDRKRLYRMMLLYAQDEDRYVAAQGHPLRLMQTRVNAYIQAADQQDKALDRAEEIAAVAQSGESLPDALGGLTAVVDGQEEG
jgi:hypothetical protein